MAEHMEVDGETNVPPAAAIGDLEVEPTTPDGDTDERLTVRRYKNSIPTLPKTIPLRGKGV